jgi:hypothetical protein
MWKGGPGVERSSLWNTLTPPSNQGHQAALRVTNGVSARVSACEWAFLYPVFTLLGLTTAPSIYTKSASLSHDTTVSPYASKSFNHVFVPPHTTNTTTLRLGFGSCGSRPSISPGVYARTRAAAVANSATIFSSSATPPVRNNGSGLEGGQPAMMPRTCKPQSGIHRPLVTHSYAPDPALSMHCHLYHTRRRRGRP